MITPILIVFGVIVLLVILLTKISPYNTENTIITLPQETKIVEKIIEKPIEIEKIVEKEIEKLVDNPELLEKIKQLEEELQKEKSKPSSEGKIYRNIGLELYQEKNLNKFTQLLKETIGKQVLVVTDSSFVLGENFKDHKIYEGKVLKYDIIQDRTPEQPIVRFYINVPILSTTNVQLNWVFDGLKFDSDFSSSKLVSDFLKTRKPVNEIFLMEV